MTIIQALNDDRFFRSSFKDPTTWAAWRLFLKALFGLPISSDDGGLELFRRCTGREKPPEHPARESYVICGRRSGKSFMSAVIAIYLACFKDWSDYLSRGERGWVFIVAVDKMQAGIIKQYASGLLNSIPSFRAAVDHETQWEIHLRNHVVISVKTCNFRAVRGYTILSAILEEVAFARDDFSANPAQEILTALRPGLATIPESLLLAISTPYTRSGLLYEQFRAHWGQDDGPLIWKAPTRLMNPTIDQGLIDSAIRQDPQAARAEWLSEFRDDISAFIPPEVAEACIVPGRFELPRVQGIRYSAAIDPSGGRQDSMTLAVAHREKSGKVVLDVLRERRPPFKPQAVVEEYANVLKSFDIHSAGSDHYAGEWVTEAFSKCGITIENSELSSSQLYLELLPVLNNGGIELLDSKRLASQLAGLERRPRSGGRDLITHYPGGHDDLGAVLAGVVVRVMNEENYLRSEPPSLGFAVEELTEEEKLKRQDYDWLLGRPSKKPESEEPTDEELMKELEADEEKVEPSMTIKTGWKNGRFEKKRT